MADITFNGSTVDLAFRRFIIWAKIFTKSWGNPGILKRTFELRRNVMSKGAAMEIIERTAPKMECRKEEVRNEVRSLEGQFVSPYAKICPEMMPGNVGIAHWKGVFPKSKKRALVVHLAGTGDHSYFRREVGFANHLLKQEVSSVMLQNPFYGSRRPPNQFRSNLLNVSDLFVMGGALITECNFLLDWARKQGYWPVGLAGVSMGGHMASLASSNTPFPVSLTPCLSWTTAAPVFVEGALSCAIPWEILANELISEKFSSAVKDIPYCDWIERAYEENTPSAIRSPITLAKRFMYILMEEFTNLKNYPKPFDASLVKSIVAERDAYIVTRGVPSFQDVWPGSSVEVLKNLGHVEAYIYKHYVFRKCILEMLNRNERCYHCPC